MTFKQLNIPCKLYRIGNPLDGYEYECEYYDSSGLCVECDECICNFGHINPINGKRINFILMFIQNRRAIKYYKIKEKENTNTRGLRSKIRGIM